MIRFFTEVREMNIRKMRSYILALMGICSASFVSAEGEVKALRGAFFQINDTIVAMNGAEMREELGAMKAVGMDLLIVQYARYDSLYYFPQRSEGEVDSQKDTIGSIMDAADALGMKVYLGLGLDSSFWQGKIDIRKHLDDNRGLLDALWLRYGSRPSFAGWYLPEEVDDRNFQTKERVEMTRFYLDGIVSHAKSLSSAPVLLAPYFGQKPNGAAYAAFWDKVLGPNHPDVIAMQDGVGCRRTTVKEASGVLRDLAEVMKKHGVRLWVDIEGFDQIHGWPVDDAEWAAVPATLERLRSQIEAETPFAEEAVVFDFPSYLSPRASPALYSAYASYRAAAFPSSGDTGR
jgi:hypothetical protein